MWRFYGAFDLAAMFLMAVAAWGALRARRAVTPPSPPQHPVRSWAGALVRALGAGLLVLVPTFSYGWGGLWTWAPDLAVVIAALALLLAVAAALQVIGLLRAWRTNRPHPPPNGNITMHPLEIEHLTRGHGPVVGVPERHQVNRSTP
jgi:hypothetical protein